MIAHDLDHGRGVTRRRRLLAALLVACLGPAEQRPGRAEEGGSPFATAVHQYAPAPGQFVRDADFGDPVNALGAPDGLGTGDGNNATVVTLGGFGGFVVLGFDHMVRDAPLNPFGLDAIVFGNAFWRERDPRRHWAECATIEISLDVNGNGLPDDAWYLIPGSHLPGNARVRSAVTWDTNLADPMFPPSSASWLPPGAHGAWTTLAYALPSSVFAANVVANPVSTGDEEGIWGYADYSPTLMLGDLNADDEIDDPTIAPEEFYSAPDDPFTVGVTTGSGGGDAFDIAWAIDATTGAPARLPGFHFIRITTAVAAVSPVFGEKSAEIDAVADAAVDPHGDSDADEDIDLADAAAFQRCLGQLALSAFSCHALARDGGMPTLVDWFWIAERFTGPIVFPAEDAE